MQQRNENTAQKKRKKKKSIPRLKVYILLDIFDYFCPKLQSKWLMKHAKLLQKATENQKKKKKEKFQHQNFSLIAILSFSTAVS